MTLDRRSFLKLAAATPCVFGLRELLAQEEPDRRPEWFRAALKRMKERGIPGVVVVAPAGAEESDELGRRLWDLLEGASPEAHELFLTGVFVVMTPALAAASGLPKSDETFNRFLIDGDMKRIAADTVELPTFEKGESFVASFGPCLHGESGERLKARADELETTAAPEVVAALRELGSDDIEARERASAALLARADGLVPLLAWKRRSAPEAEVRSRLLAVLERHFRSFATDKPGVRLPFGTRIPKFQEHGCGGLREVPENEKEDRGPMVGCGMGRVENTKVRMFLRFLSK